MLSGYIEISEVSETYKKEPGNKRTQGAAPGYVSIALFFVYVRYVVR